MYFQCSLGHGVLSNDNLYYSGDTSLIYLHNNLLYKVYLKKEPYKRKVLDILISKDNLRNIGVLPIKKLVTDTNQYGMIMHYIPNAVTFRKYLQNNHVSLDTMLNIMITLSDHLKLINKEKIHFSDLHHNNILIDEYHNPIYIDFDDAVVDGYNSTHICALAYNLHNVQDKSYEYEDKLINYGNLDQECLFIMLLNYLLDIYIEKQSYDNFNYIVKWLNKYFPSDFIKAIKALKTLGDEVIPYQYYVGDFIKDLDIKKQCKKLRGDLYAYHRF